MSVAMFRAPAGFTPKSTSGFVTVLEARKRGMKAVLDETTKRREHPGLAQHALWATADLMEQAGDDEQQDMREAVVLSVLETMRAHRNHSSIQFNGVRALTAALRSANATMVAREGAVTSVIQAMQTHSACRDSGWALLVLLGEYQSLLDAPKGGAAEPEPEPDGSNPTGAGDGTDRASRVMAVLRAMTVHLPRLGVQQYGIASLYGLISGEFNEETGGEIAPEEKTAAGETLIAAEGVSTVLRAMQTHAAQDEVQNGGLKLLRLCVEADERLSAFIGRAVAAHSGGLGALLDAMRGCIRLAPSLADGLVVMASVVLSSEAGHSALVQAGGTRVGLQSIQCHESVVSVQCVGLRLLAALAAAPESVPALLQEGAMRTVMHGLRVHAADDPPTAAAACLTLVRFTRHAPELAASQLSDDWETLCEGVVGKYGATYSIAGHISEAVPLLRQHYDKYA
jgi:hypothetical protein